MARTLLVSALLFCTSGLFAASPWTPVGPPGGAVYGLAIDPKDAHVLYAGTWAGGIWKSKDGGANWTRLSGPPVDETFNGVVVSPADSRLVLGASPLGLYRSADAGVTWKKVMDLGPTSQPEMTGFAFDPAKPAIVYASTDADGHPAGVFKSTDSGTTWKAANEGIHQNSRVYNVAVSRDSASVFAASSDGVYQSDDGGATWKLALSGKATHSVATGPDGIVLAGTQGDGIWRTTDGSTWEVTTTDAKMSGNRVFALLSSSATPGLVYAGVPNRILRSTDGGVTWKTFARQFNWINFRSVAIDEKSGAVFGGTGRDGVVKSIDGGETWTTGAGILSLGVTSILVDPAAPKRIFVGTTQGGLHRSDDGGATWTLSNEGITSRSVHSIAAHPTEKGTLMVGTREGAFRSTDSGASWTHTLKGGCDPEVQHLRFVPSNPKRVWAHSGRDFCQVMRSDDGGLTWKESKTPRPDSSMVGHFAFHVDATDPDKIAFNTDRKLHLSTDGGTTWTEATGIPATSRIQAIIATKSAEQLFAATTDGIYRSADGGKTWTASGGADLNVRRLLFDPASGTIWAGAWKGVHRSTDDGKTWSRVGGDPPHPDVVALALESKALLVGFSGGGVYRLTP